LIPFGPRPESRSTPAQPTSPEAAIEPNPLLDRLNPADGPRLLELGTDLMTRRHQAAWWQAAR